MGNNQSGAASVAFKSERTHSQRWRNIKTNRDKYNLEVKQILFFQFSNQSGVASERTPSHITQLAVEKGEKDSDKYNLQFRQIHFSIFKLLSNKEVQKN